MIVEDLLGLPPVLRDLEAAPEMGPLREEDALREAEILERAWYVVGSSPATEAGAFRLVVECAISTWLLVVATRAACVTGSVPGIGAGPPDYVQDDEKTIRAGIAGWRSAFAPIAATFTGPDGGSC